MLIITLYNVCAVLGGAQCHKGVQYRGGYHEYCGDIQYRGDILRAMGDIMMDGQGGYHDGYGGYHDGCGGYHAYRGDVQCHRVLK